MTVSELKTQKMIELDAAVKNYKTAMTIYVRIFTPEQWEVVNNAFQAVERLDREYRAL